MGEVNERDLEQVAGGLISEEEGKARDAALNWLYQECKPCKKYSKCQLIAEQLEKVQEMARQGVEYRCPFRC